MVQEKETTLFPRTKTIILKTTTKKQQKYINKAERKPKTVCRPCDTWGKTNHSTDRCYCGDNATNRPPPRQNRPEQRNEVPQRGNQSHSNQNCSSCTSKFKLKMPRFHSGTATDRPETIELPPTPEVFWQHTHETHLFNTHKKLNH